jgi:hypothetical protein
MRTPGLSTQCERLDEFLLTQNIFQQRALVGSRDSSVGIATGYGLDDHEGWEFKSR